jgi:16S rRNA (cytosine967-C5)-methyltransferase
MRGYVNAILRKVSVTPVEWPSDAHRLSYPDWIVERLHEELGADDLVPVLETMNRPPLVHRRDDGYVQDPASIWVADAVQAGPGDLVLDVCAAPGGKATRIAHSGAKVVAIDAAEQRARLVVANAATTKTAVSVVVADGRAAPVRQACADRVLVDAPCSGLGTLRRRPDARWRMTPDDLNTLIPLQQDLIDCAAAIVKPGGLLVYSVCTLTEAESIGHRFPQGWEQLPPPSRNWRPYGSGARVLPHDHDTDGMTIVRYRRPA